MEIDEKLLEQLLAFVRGELGEVESTIVRERITTDPHLQEFVAMLTALEREGETDTWASLRDPAHSLLDQLLRDVNDSTKRPTERRGVVTFDSRLLPLPEGVRPAGVDSHRLRYRIGDDRLELSSYPVSMNTFEVIGQYNSDQNSNRLIAELRVGKKTYSTEANQFGLFRFPRVESGKCHLQLKDAGAIVATVEFEL